MMIKVVKTISLIVGILLFIGGIFIGLPFIKKLYTRYQVENSLTNTVLDIEIEPESYQKAEGLANGQLIYKKPFELSQVPPVWNKISSNDVLLDEYQYVDQVEFFQVLYKSDSLLVNGILAQPKRSGQFPVIIFNRGGNQESGVMGKAKTLNSLMEVAKLVEEGYVLIASCYREKDKFGGKDIHDVVYLKETIKELPKADHNRIGMAGWSRGGMMTYLALKNSDFIKTAAIINGPTNLPDLITERPIMESQVCAKLIPDYEENKAQELANRSVVNWADELDDNASLLILYGTEDKRVSPEQALQIGKKLKDITYDFSLKGYRTDHKFTGKKNELYSTLRHWFKTRL